MDDWKKILRQIKRENLNESQQRHRMGKAMAELIDAATTKVEEKAVHDTLQLARKGQRGGAFTPYYDAYVYSLMVRKHPLPDDWADKSGFGLRQKARKVLNAERKAIAGGSASAFRVRLVLDWFAYALADTENWLEAKTEKIKRLLSEGESDDD